MLQLKRAATAAAVMLLFAALAAMVTLATTTVAGVSMEDTLHEGDRLVFLRTDLLGHVPTVKRRLLGRGAIVLLEDPLLPGRVVVKRIAAVGGDRMEISNGTLLINGERQREPPTVRVSQASWPVQRGSGTPIAVDHYFVLADNRLTALDSRVYGAVRAELIIGVVISVLHERHAP